MIIEIGDNRNNLKSILRSASNHLNMVQEICNDFVPKIKEIINDEIKANIFTVPPEKDEPYEIFVMLEFYDEGEIVMELDLNFEVSDLNNFSDKQLSIRTRSHYFPMPLIQSIVQIVEESIFNHQERILN